MLRAATDAEPWAIPVATVLALVSLVLSPFIAGKVGAPAVACWLYLTAIGGVVSVTLSPTGGAISGPWSSHIIRSLQPEVPQLHDLTTINEVSLNIAAAVPLGLASVVLTYYVCKGWPLIALILPMVCELLQGVFPQLGRVGFVLGDSINNELGVILGCAVGVVVVLVLSMSPLRRSRRRRVVDSGRPSPVTDV